MSPPISRILSAALVGAAVLSTIVFPVLGLRVRHDLDEEVVPEVAATVPVA